MYFSQFFGRSVFRRALIALSLVFVVAACDSIEDRVADHYERGQELLAEGAKAKAVLEFRNALKLNTDHAPSLLALAQISEENGNHQDAFNQYKRVTEIDNENYKAHAKLTRYMILSNDLENAAQSYEMVKKLRADDLDTYVLEAALALRGDRMDEARKALDKALAQDANSVDAILLDINYVLKTGDNELALARTDQALASDPDNRQLNTIKLQILQSLGDTSGVGEQLSLMVGYDPENIPLLEAQARWAIESGAVDMAVPALRSLATLQPDKRVAAFDLVRYVRAQQGEAAGRAELERMIAEADDPFDLRLMLAQYEEETGSPEAAAEMLRNLTEIDDASRANEARIALARLALRQDDQEQGLALVQEALAADPSEVEAIVLWAAHLIEDDQLDAATPFVRTGLNEAPEDVRLLMLSGQLQERLGNIDLAADRMAKAVSIRNYHPSIVDPYVQFLNRIGRDRAVETTLVEANRRHPNNDRILDQLGFVRAKLEDWVGADRVAQQLSQTNPDRARQLRAAILIGQERFDEGASLLRTLPQDQRQRAASIAALVQTYIRNGEPDEAIAFLDDLLQKNPDNLQALGLRGNLYLASGDTEAAVAAYYRILDIDPGNAGARSALARLFQLTGEFEKAEEELLGGLSINPDNLFLKTRLAQFRELQGNFQSAIELYSEVQQSVPNSLLITNNLASLLADHHADDPEAVDKAYQLANRLRDSSFPQYRDTYGWTRYLRGEYEEALEFIKPAVEDLPTNPWVNYHLAKVYLAMEQPAEALGYLQRAADLVRNDAAFPPLQEVQILLKELKDS